MKVTAPVAYVRSTLTLGEERKENEGERRLTQHVEIGSNQTQRSTQGTPLYTDVLGNDMAHEKGCKQDRRTNRKDDACP